MSFGQRQQSLHQHSLHCHLDDAQRSRQNRCECIYMVHKSHTTAEAIAMLDVSLGPIQGQSEGGTDVRQIVQKAQ